MRYILRGEYAHNYDNKSDVSLITFHLRRAVKPYFNARVIKKSPIYRTTIRYRKFRHCQWASSERSESCVWSNMLALIIHLSGARGSFPSQRRKGVPWNSLLLRQTPKRKYEMSMRNKRMNRVSLPIANSEQNWRHLIEGSFTIPLIHPIKKSMHHLTMMRELIQTNCIADNTTLVMVIIERDAGLWSASHSCEMDVMTLDSLDHACDAE